MAFWNNVKGKYAKYKEWRENYEKNRVAQAKIKAKRDTAFYNAQAARNKALFAAKLESEKVRYEYDKLRMQREKLAKMRQQEAFSNLNSFIYANSSKKSNGKNKKNTIW